MESMREILGGQKMQIIDQLNEDLRRAHRIIDDLLCWAGRPTVCFSCARPIMRIGSADKAFNYNGEPHCCSFPVEVPHA